MVRWQTERTTVMQSMTWAIRGSSSHTVRPGTLEAIGLNSPRSSAGAFGFMSNVSCWGTPPNW